MDVSTLDEPAWTLEADEAFTNCRKYLAPSVALSETPHAGPVSREPISISDAWLEQVVAGAETSFLASISPDGQPDVSHRGGLPGFLQLDGRHGDATMGRVRGRRDAQERRQRARHRPRGTPGP